MKTEIKKKLLNDFKQRKIIGGICAIKNNVNGKILLENSYNIESNRNRFEFSKKIGSAVSLKIIKNIYLPFFINFL